MVGTNVSDWNESECQDNHFHSERVQGVETPLDCFKLFLSEEFIDLTVAESRKYAQQQNQPRKVDKVTHDTVWATMAIILMSGYNCVPARRMYWAQKPDLHNEMISKAIRRDTCEDVLSVLHFTDNEDRTVRSDKFHKVRPIFDIINSASKKYLPITEYVSVDEMMVPYFGKSPWKQFIKGKPIRSGFKIWAICSSDGYTIHLEPYAGSYTQLPEYGLGQGPNVVLGLVEKSQKIVRSGTKIVCDNLFTSIPLAEKLSEKRMGLLGTVNANRLVSTPILEPKTFAKKHVRGEYVTYFTEDVSLTAWMDNKSVTILSNIDYGTTLACCERWVKDPTTQVSKKTRFSQPQVVKNYNKYMGGVDLVDSQVAVYRSNVRKNKWWFSIFTTGVSIMCVNAWRLWNTLHPSPKMPYIEFVREVCVSILSNHKEARLHPGPLPTLRVNADEKRFDRMDHLIIKSKVKG